MESVCFELWKPMIQNPGAATEVLSRVIEELARKEAWPRYEQKRSPPA